LEAPEAEVRDALAAARKRLRRLRRGCRFTVGQRPEESEIAMPDTIEREHTPWKTPVAVAGIAAPVFAILWLAITLTTQRASLSFAFLKIVFTIVAVGTGISAIKWTTASGIALLVESLAALAWVLLKVEDYPPFGAPRTVFLLIIPLAVSGLALILAGGIKAGTWPPERFRVSK
jgi:hypothetical protein